MFRWMELHVPQIFPLLKIVKIFLQGLVLTFFAVQDGVICKKAHSWGKTIWEVIDVK